LSWLLSSGSPCPPDVPIVPYEATGSSGFIPPDAPKWIFLYPAQYNVNVECVHDNNNLTHILVKVTYSTNNPAMPEMEFDDGIINLKHKYDIDGVGLPSPGFAVVHMPAVTFRYAFTQPDYTQWFGPIDGYADAGGNQRQRIMYCLNRVDSGGFLGSLGYGSAVSSEMPAGQWLFTGFKARLMPTWVVRVECTFAWACFPFYDGTNWVLQSWQWVDDNGQQHDILGSADFSSVIGLTWPTGEPL